MSRTVVVAASIGIAFVVGVLFLVGDPDSEPSHPQGESTDEAPSQTPQDVEAPPPATEAESLEEVEGRDGVVVIRMFDDNTYDPPHPEVQVGDTLVWVNEGDVPHTATLEPGRAADEDHEALPEGAEAFDSGNLETDEVHAHVVDAPGEYAYVCTLHELLGMVGSFTAR